MDDKLDTAIANSKQLADALRCLCSCFDENGNLREEYQDQLSVALEKADAALCCIP